MISFRESDLRLSFARRRWAVRKYDAHDYYLGLSGAHLKGVDFLAVQEGRRLVFLEVKNYPGAAGRRLSSEQLAAELMGKIADTFTGIDAICTMLERKRLYRFASPLLPYLPAQNYDWPFWHQAGLLSALPRKCTAVLCLENTTEGLRRELQPQLQEGLQDIVGRIIFAEAGSRPLPGLHIDR